MTDLASDVDPGGSSLPRACDHCRSRKIRCDKLSPCSSCKTAGVICQLTDTGRQEHRQRVLISDQYERKIDSIENRLEGIENLLKALLANSSSGNRSTASSTAVSPSNDGFRPEQDDTASSKQFEGDSSLTAHSKHAHRTLESLLQAYPSVRYDPEVATALLSLQETMRKQDDDSSRRNCRLGSKEPNSLTVDDLELPPYENVLEVLRNVKDADSPFFFVWFPYLDFFRFSQYCEDIYFKRDSCSLAIETVACVGLSAIFDEYAESHSSPPHYQECRTIFLRRFKACLSRFSLLAEPSFENCLALVLGSTYAISIADFSLCLTFTCTAARMCQSLGWHRAIIVNKGTHEEVQSRKLLFWNIYYCDKSLSLRLGRGSMLQDYDIALDLPEIPSNPKIRSWALWTNLLVEIGAIHGLIYEKLYSPGASSQTAETRLQIIQELADRANAVLPRNAQIYDLTVHYPQYMRLFTDSNEVVLKCLLTLIYRASPQAFENPFMFSDNCLLAARAAMEAHQRSIRNLQPGREQAWTEYSAWTILNCPFTPFMVIFCHTVRSCDLDDLKVLEDFVESINRPENERVEAMAKFHQLCNAFYVLAKKYVAARLREVKENPDSERRLVMANQQPLQNNTSANGLQEADMQLLSSGFGADGGLDEMELSSQWYLSNTFDGWISGDQQPLDFLGGNGSTFGAL